MPFPSDINEIVENYLYDYIYLYYKHHKYPISDFNLRNEAVHHFKYLNVKEIAIKIKIVVCLTELGVKEKIIESSLGWYPKNINYFWNLHQQKVKSTPKLKFPWKS